MILHLFQELPYIRMELKEKELAASYLSTLSFLEERETGSEACLILDHDLKPIDRGFQYPPDDEDRVNVEKMLPDKAKPHDFVIEKGTYELIQLASVPPETEIERELSPFVASGSREKVCLRMIKENAIVVVIQLLWKTQG